MKLEIEITDNKADFFLELIKNFSFVKTKIVEDKKETFLIELRGAVEEVKLAKKGQLKTKSLQELLDEV
ncbi:MAG: hypothetical protein K2Q22_06260 [Cytophagales bacterium]|nr:hypothetical protein [Cytophagales bacterium]